ncbi:hypothetical protein V6N12_023206 [Hibiscus sabdariffa]|uniref:Disease resistance protein At4g27190-like leucine-rich repeats domain-containing protein n=1 Tax=Hibiscus sabdariffa TaxID=183260 RepID=A0ABR2FXE9_9ROSI
MDEISMKLDFVWAPYVVNLIDLMTDFETRKSCPNAMVMGDGLWDMLHFNSAPNYEFALRMLKTKVVSLLSLSTEVSVMINGVLNTEEKREKMGDAMWHAYDRALGVSKLLRQTGHSLLLLDSQSLTWNCGPHCTSDGPSNSATPMTHISYIKLIRTDTTLDLSQKAEKGPLDSIVQPVLNFKRISIHTNGGFTLPTGKTPVPEEIIILELRRVRQAQAIVQHLDDARNSQCELIAHVSYIKLIKTDTPLGLSQKAKKGVKDVTDMLYDPFIEGLPHVKHLDASDIEVVINSMICNMLKKLFSFSVAKGLRQLEELKISCPPLKELDLDSTFAFDDGNCRTNISLDHSSLFNEKVILPLLEKLEFYKMDNLVRLSHGRLAEHSFSKLTSVRLSFCPKLSNVLPLSILTRLQRLDRPSIWNCESLEEIVSESQSPENGSSSAMSSLPLQLIQSNVTAFEFPCLTFLCHSDSPNLKKTSGNTNQHSATPLLGESVYISKSTSTDFGMECRNQRDGFQGQQLSHYFGNLKAVELENYPEHTGTVLNGFNSTILALFSKVQNPNEATDFRTPHDPCHAFWLRVALVMDAAKVNFDPAGYGGVPRNQEAETAECCFAKDLLPSCSLVCSATYQFSRKMMEALLAIVGSLAVKAAEYIADPTAQQLGYIFKNKS